MAMLFLAVLAAQVTLDQRMATVQSIVEELARKSGRPLAIKESLRNEVCFVHLEPHDPDTLMRLLAQSTSTEWTFDTGKYYLDRPLPLRRKQAAAERAISAANIATYLKALLPDDDSEPWDDPVGRYEVSSKKIDSRRYVDDPAGFQLAQARLRLINPAGRLLSRILRHLPNESIASIQFGETARFAPRPLRRQNPLPVSEASLGQYLAERRNWVQRLSSMPAEVRTQYGGLIDDLNDPGAGPITPLLTAQRFVDGTVNLELILLNAKNVEVDSIWLMIPGRIPPIPPSPTPSWWSEKTSPDPGLESFFAGLVSKDVDPRQAALARDPVAHEPLEILFGSALKSLAKARGQETIFPVPDELCNDLSFLRNAPLGKIDTAMAGVVTFETVDGVRLGHARWPDSNAATKMDRAALKDLLSKLEGGRFPSIEQIADYAVRQNLAASNNRLERAVILGGGYWRSGQLLSGMFSPDFGGRDVLRFYGSLSPSGQSALRQGTPISFSALPPAARAALDLFTFRRNLQHGNGRLFQDASFQFNDLRAGGWISSKPTPSYPLLLQSPASDRVDFENLSGAAYAKFQADTGQASPDAPDIAKVRWVPVTMEGFDISFHLSDTFRKSSSLVDVLYNPNGPTFTVENLPTQHLKEFNRTLSVIRANNPK